MAALFMHLFSICSVVSGVGGFDVFAASYLMQVPDKRFVSTMCVALQILNVKPT